MGTLGNKIDGFVVGEGEDRVEIDLELSSLGNQVERMVALTDITNRGQAPSFSLVVWRTTSFVRQ